MKTLLSLSVSLLLASANASAASVVYTYNSKGETDGIQGVAGISQESSWRCKSDSSLLCQCPSAVFKGRIESVDYRKGDTIPEGFVVDTGRTAEYVVMAEDWDADLGTADSSWIPRLIRKGERVLVVAERCGVGGNNVVARDVYFERLINNPAPRAKR